MQTCTRCGNSLSVNDKFCPNCGIALNTYPAPAFPSEEGKFDFRRLAKFIIIGGLLVFSFGGAIYALNLPASPSASAQKLDPNPNSEDFYQRLYQEGTRDTRLLLENMTREERRSQGMRIMLYGTAIAVVGMVIMASIRKK